MPQTKTVILHIGLPKTGTGFLQHTFAENSEALGRHDIHYLKAGGHPSFTDPGHHLLAMRLMAPRRADVGARVDALAAQDVWDAARAEIEASAASIHVISSEWFALDVSVLDEIIELKRLIGSFEVRVVVALRPVVELVNSLYAQRVRDGFVGSPIDLVELLWPQLDWRTVVERWRGVFGRERVQVLEYNQHTRRYWLKYFVNNVFPGRLDPCQLAPTRINTTSLAMPITGLIGYINTLGLPERSVVVEHIVKYLQDLGIGAAEGDNYLSPDLARALTLHCRPPLP